MQKYFAYLVLLILPVSLLAFTVPAKPSTYVNDYANILKSDEVIALEGKIESFEKNTTNEIAVVTIPSLDGDTVENVAQEIFTKWGIGKKDKHNGVLLLVSLAEHKTRIQTGYGVEGDLTDIATSYIQSDIMTPSFRAGDYYGGINDAVDKMIEALGGSSIVPDNYSQNRPMGFGDWIHWVMLAVFGLSQVIRLFFYKSKSWWAGGVLGGIVGIFPWFLGMISFVGAIPLVILLVVIGLGLDFLFSSPYEQYKSGRGPWDGFWGGGRGGGGGFGGFGGGGSGGGGSSGSW
jgi:uncharacterized protein